MFSGLQRGKKFHGADLRFPCQMPTPQLMVQAMKEKSIWINRWDYAVGINSPKWDAYKIIDHTKRSLRKKRPLSSSISYGVKEQSVTLNTATTLITAAVILLHLSDLPLCLSHPKSLTSQFISFLQCVCAVPQTMGLDLLDFAALPQKHV